MNQFSKIAALTGFTILIFPLITVAQTLPSADRRGTIVTPSPQTPNSHTHFNSNRGSRSHGLPSSEFDAFTVNNNSQLMSSPRGFVFSRESPTVIHHRNFPVPQEQTKGNGWVRISPAGNLLNLEVQSQRSLANPSLPMVALPQILTGGNQKHATTVHLRKNGTIQLSHPVSSNSVADGGRSTAERSETPLSVPPSPLRVEDAAIQLLPSDHTQLPTQQILSEANIREMLSQIEAQTDQKPAVIYAITHPQQLVEQIEGVELQSQSGLTLMLVLPDGQPIVKSIPEVELKKLRRVAREFYSEVSDPRTTGWPAARQLYQWLIAPLEPHFREEGIDTLLFYLDEGLRSIPLAALYDGQQFLIETYNFSLIPSLSLTNASYEGLEDAEVLAMGMSEFVDQSTLSSVPTEILTITEKLWPGEALLNQAFTLENLHQKLSQQAFKIVHLATHAHFNPQQNGYIQFWDRKLPLKQLRDLEWYKQPQVELLVLSACETGLGNTPETEMGFAGLAHQAGVKSALASLWQVSDVGTLGLMVEFYRNLKSSSIKAEALRQAQLALLLGGVEVEAGLLHSTRGDASVSNTLAVRLQTEDLSHPYYWAGFTMIGSPW